MYNKAKMIQALQTANVEKGVIRMSTQVRDILIELLSDELVKPRKWIPKRQVYGQVRGYYCAVCNASLVRGDKYCHECGRRLVWDD